MEKFDFSGWATKANLKCSDGRTIMKDAFKHNDGMKVPLVWNHQHNNPDEVLGHALLENRDEGVYAYCTFNETESGKTAKLLVEHGDIQALSIYANQLKEKMSNVLHGNIREVSLVLAGANPGASIDSIILHGEESDDEAIIYTGEDLVLTHSDEESDEKEDNNEDELKEEESEEEADKKSKESEDDESSEEIQHAEGEESLQAVFDTLSDKQKNLVYGLVGMVADGELDEDEDDEGGNDNMKHNVFDQDDQQETNVLSHSDMAEIFADAKRYGSLKDAFKAHEIEEVNMLNHSAVDSQGNTVTYGIADIDYLFPEAKLLNNPPAFISRKMEWVPKVMNGVHHTPFSRIKSQFANITEDDARAKGYIKGNLKKEEVFTLLKRTTTPTTIYKKQKLDRDDVVDIVDLDVVGWLKKEMRMMLDEEIARAILVGDGRSGASEDKINESNIRPIWTDEDLYTVKKTIQVAADATDDQKAKAFIRAVVKSRKDYKGSGNPTLFTTEDVITDCLLMEDTTGRVIYDTIDKLKTVLRVNDIITTPVMENQTRTVSGDTRTLMAILVNLADYNVGADKGGAVNMFDDFDIDYNQMKYLIETRCSGALTVPYSAIVFELDFQ